MKKLIALLTVVGTVVLFPWDAMAAQSRELVIVPHTDPLGIFCVVIFVLSYLLVMAEEKTLLRKSKPVMLGAGIIWVTIALAAPEHGIEREQLRQAIFHDLDEYGSLMLFLMAAMIYISALESFNVFGALRSNLVSMRLSFRQLFWATGIIAFFLSAVADNLTTALVMGAVVMAVGADHSRFVAIAMVNIVCAANAGGAFSPFGDITTLMVWQSGRVEFIEFFALFIPSVATFIVPAAVMSFAVPAEQPSGLEERIVTRRGAKRGIVLGLLTISMAVSFEHFLGIPPFMGMMTGLSLLMFLAYYLCLTRREGEPDYNIFEHVKAVEWDTLLN